MTRLTKPKFKILVCLDGSEYSDSATTLAIRRVKITGGTLVGLSIIDLPGIESVACGAGIGAASYAHNLQETKLKEATERSAQIIEKFTKDCQKGEVLFETRVLTGNPFEEIVKIGKLFDLLIIGKKSFFSYQNETGDGDAVTQLLENPLCPVIAVNKIDKPTKNIIFAYDGSYNAAHAMKSFLYLSPFKESDFKFHILRVGTDDEETKLDLADAASYLATHEISATQHLLRGEPLEVVCEFCHSMENPFLVIGASSKGFVNQFFFGKVSNKIYQDPTLPFFVFL